MDWDVVTDYVVSAYCQSIWSASQRDVLYIFALFCCQRSGVGFGTEESKHNICPALLNVMTSVTNHDRRPILFSITFTTEPCCSQSIVKVAEPMLSRFGNHPDHIIRATSTSAPRSRQNDHPHSSSRSLFTLDIAAL